MSGNRHEPRLGSLENRRRGRGLTSRTWCLGCDAPPHPYTHDHRHYRPRIHPIAIPDTSISTASQTHALQQSLPLAPSTLHSANHNFPPSLTRSFRPLASRLPECPPTRPHTQSSASSAGSAGFHIPKVASSSPSCSTGVTNRGSTALQPTKHAATNTETGTDNGARLCALKAPLHNNLICSTQHPLLRHAFSSGHTELEQDCSEPANASGR